MPDELVEAAYAFLRGHTTGDLRFDEHVRPIKFVIGPEGRMVASIMYAMLEAVDTVLFVPEEADDAMQVQVTLAKLDEEGRDGAMTDRWRIYHGEPRDVHWAFLDLDAARYHDSVIDGDALVRANPLGADESRICKDINAVRSTSLRAVCRHFTGVDVEQPLLVGIDPLGFDVRGPFSVLRVRVAAPMNTADEAQQVLDQMVRESG
ncbi:MAG: DUF2470 domain-containing protein [Planctomycetota bacterium]|jgi:hypothetical protein